MQSRGLAKCASCVASMRMPGIEDALGRFGTDYSLIDHGGRKTYLHEKELDFDYRRHVVSLHPTSSPATPEHILSNVLITYCLCGTLTLVLDGEPTVIAAGECVVLDRRVPHLIEETGDEDVSVDIVLADEFFDGFMLDGIACLASPFATALTNTAGAHDDWRHYRTADDETVRTCVERILCERLDPDPTSPYLVNFFLAALFTHLMRTYEPHGQLADEVWERVRLIEQVREYINQHYREGNLGQKAIDLGYERTYLSKLIRTHTGSTFKQLVNAERMRHASLMLRGTTRPIYDIAQAVGLANLTSFYQRFREHYGCTPKEYRDAR